ncbi:MAG TPA: RES family NAD+ phosphorylase [Acidimicrobiales bacterium]
MTRPAYERQLPSLGGPPPAERLAGFPVWHVHAGTVLCRVTSADHGPWWFSSTGEGRFDLAPPRGTCYLADDEVGAVLEVLGPLTMIVPSWAKRRSLWHLDLPAQCSAADLTVRAARGFGITAEVMSIVPYRVPQMWAGALAAAGYQGIRYRIRHDPGGARALALFGATGERTSWPRGRRRAIDDDLLAQVAHQAGITVAPIPHSEDVGELLD